MAMIGRLKPGVTADAAQAEIRTLAGADHRRSIPSATASGQRQAARPTGQRPHPPGGLGARRRRRHGDADRLREPVEPAARADRGAQKEIAIRTALGAGRRRLIAQMLTEGIVLSCSGAMLGVVLASPARARWRGSSRQHPAAARRAHRRHGARLHAGDRDRHRHRLRPGARAPGARRALTNALKDATRGSTEGRRRAWVRNALVVSEIAFACVLLVGAGLLIRSLMRVLDVDMGFEPARAATMRVDPDSRYRDTRTAQRVLRRGPAPREGDPWRRERGHHRRAAARPQPHLGRAGQGRDLRARPFPARVRRASSATATRRRWAFRCAPAATSLPATRRPASP